jgi:hypothetical protein
MVSVELTRQSVKDAPPYDANIPPDAEQQLALDLHYGRHGKWAHDCKPQTTHSRIAP